MRRRPDDLEGRVERLLAHLDPAAACPECWAIERISYDLQGALVPDEAEPAPERCRHGRTFRDDHRWRIELREVPTGWRH